MNATVKALALFGDRQIKSKFIYCRYTYITFTKHKLCIAFDRIGQHNIFF
jgi:hypothetical protein